MAEECFAVPSSNVLGRAFLECGIEWDWLTLIERIRTCLGNDHPTQMEDVYYRRCERTGRILGMTVNPIRGHGLERRGYLLLGNEITERRSMEHQLAQAQKLESIGQLAAGIAHEINTPLSTSEIIAGSCKKRQRSREILHKYKGALEGCPYGTAAHDSLAEAKSAAAAA